MLFVILSAVTIRPGGGGGNLKDAQCHPFRCFFMEVVPYLHGTALTLWPFKFKWTPVALDWLFVLTEVLCSENLSLSILSGSPMYFCEHLSINNYINTF